MSQGLNSHLENIRNTLHRAEKNVRMIVFDHTKDIEFDWNRAFKKIKFPIMWFSTNDNLASVEFKIQLTWNRIWNPHHMTAIGQARIHKTSNQHME